MLAELATANAAFAIIKTAVQNTGDLTRVAHKIAEYSGAKQSIERQAREDRSAGKSGSDLESFMALEEIKKQEIHLKELMIGAGRPGLLDDRVKFQAQARVQRQQEEAEREAWATELCNNVGMTAVAISLVIGIFGLIYFAIYLKGL
jgi:hypothetical protein